MSGRGGDGSERGRQWVGSGGQAAFRRLRLGCTDSPTLRLSARRLGGGAPSFRYLSQSDAYTLSEVDDAEEFRWGLGWKLFLSASCSPSMLVLCTWVVVVVGLRGARRPGACGCRAAQAALLAHASKGTTLQ